MYLRHYASYSYVKPVKRLVTYAYREKNMEYFSYSVCIFKPFTRFTTGFRASQCGFSTKILRKRLKFLSLRTSVWHVAWIPFTRFTLPHLGCYGTIVASFLPVDTPLCG